MEILTKKVKLNLVGLDGNAFSIIGAFSRAARRQGFNKEEIDSVINVAKQGDYDHLLNTFLENTQEEDDV